MPKDPIHRIHEMTEGRRREIMRTEGDLIRYFTNAARETLDESVIVPPGDDAAVLAPTPGMELVNTVDVLVENVDFDFAYARPDDVGYKSVMVNLSDIAAMRGRPRWVTVGLGMKEIDVDMIEGLSAGFLAACKEANVCLVGGDISSAPCMMLSVNVVGEVAAGRAVTRSGAKEGMVISVTGPLGGSYAGFKFLSSKDIPTVRKRVLSVLEREHLRPKARYDLVPRLEAVEIGAMIDISDGFLIDLKRVLKASSIGGEINTHLIPILPETVEAAGEVGANPLKWALRGGEDFELIICLYEDEFNKLITVLPDSGDAPIPIGRIIPGPADEIVLLDKRGKRLSFSEEGFDHFSGWEVV